MCLRCLRRAVARVIGPGHHRIFGNNVQDIAPDTLLFHHGDTGFRDDELPFHQDIVQAVPLFQAMLFNRPGDADTGVVHYDVYPTKSQ
ncbi:hypothetical protein D9M69_649580 [compost metagenome]